MFTDVDLVAIWLPYLRAKLKETTNRARAWPQIKTNSLMAYLFTQEINLFELCTIRYTALLVACWYFFKQKWTRASLVSLLGSAVEARSLIQAQESETQLQSNLLQVSLRIRAMLILALTPRTNQQTLPFFSRHVGSRSQWKTGEEGKEEGRKREGEKQPQGLREILYACALKRKVCGQLLKDFSGESRLSIESIE